MSELHQALVDATDEVLSTMFFTMLDTPPDAPADSGCTRIRIQFRGHWTGALSLCSSPEASAEMTANFLGLDAPDQAASQEQEAVAKELANMICGAVLSRLKSTEVFELLSPELEEEQETQGAAGCETRFAEQTFGVGAGFLRLQFRLDGPV